MSSGGDNIMNHLLRMVVPMRREFDLALNVQQFLHDQVYAQDVLEKASRSQDPRLRERAEYISKLKHGPRVGVAQPGVGKALDAPAAAGKSPMGPGHGERLIQEPVDRVTGAAESTGGLSPEDAMRQAIMKKYTDGLR